MMEPRGRVLLTGSSGFIGSKLRFALERRGFEVIGLAGRSGGDGPGCDIRDPEAVDLAVGRAYPDIVIHCAAVSGVTVRGASDYNEVNVIGTQHLLQACERVKRCTRFMFISTAGVYGNQPVNVLHEDLIPAPVHYYGMSKLAAEQLVLGYRDRLNVTIFRPFNVIGPGQNGAFIVPKLVAAFARRDPTIELGNIQVSRDFQDVMTTIRIIINAIDRVESFGKVLNLCTGDGTSIEKLIATLREITGHAPDIVQNPDLMRRDEIWRLVGCVQRLQACFGPDVLIQPALADVLHGMLQSEFVRLKDPA